MLLKSSNLTNGEKLFVSRRRAGYTQAEEADARDITLAAYRLVEADSPSAEFDIAAPAIGKLLDYEACTILRRRDDLTLDEMSKRVGLSKFLLCQIERGKANPTTLVDFWACCGVGV